MMKPMGQLRRFQVGTLEGAEKNLKTHIVRVRGGGAGYSTGGFWDRCEPRFPMQ